MKNHRSFLFIGISVLILSALTLLLFRKSSPQQPGHPEALQKRETHSHPHPHDTQAPSTLPGEETPPDENPTTQETAAAEKSPSMGLANAFQSALYLWETDPELASEKLHDIAAELGDGDPKWTEYYHLLGHSIVSRPPGAPKNGAYLTLEDAARYYVLKDELMGISEDDKKYIKDLQLSLRWNKEGEQVVHQTQPIRDLLDWMKENAPTEWETVSPHFWQTLQSRNAAPNPLREENWRGIDARVKIQYDAFFESLEQLPENARTLQTLFESSHEAAQTKISEDQKQLEALPLRTSESSTGTEHTWDMRHEATVAIDDISEKIVKTTQKSLETITAERDPLRGFQTGDFATEDLTKTLEKAFETPLSADRKKRALSTLMQYGPEDGLRRLKRDDPDIAEYIEKHLPNQHLSPEK